MEKHGKLDCIYILYSASYFVVKIHQETRAFTALGCERNVKRQQLKMKRCKMDCARDRLATVIQSG